MSHITVGYTDKVRKTQNRGPPGAISDIFGGYSEDLSNNVKPQKELGTTNQKNGHNETKMCERTESLSLEENSNQVKTTVESRKIEEVKQTQVITSVEVTNEEISNGNVKDNGNVEISTKTTQKSVNNITHSDEKDSATPSRRNRVPPGGYSTGFW